MTVTYIRSNLLVPVPRLTSVESYNARLMGRCMELSRKPHWRKGEPEEQLFVECYRQLHFRQFHQSYTPFPPT